MSDKLVLENGRAQLTTDEGCNFELEESRLMDMLRADYELPINGSAMPDGVKFVEWRPPLLCVVHQLPPHVRQLKWITDDSPAPFGPGATFRPRRLSLPYTVTFAMYMLRNGRLHLLGNNELYFRNQPLLSRDDPLCIQALLNVSWIETGKRIRCWICTQHLGHAAKDDWTQQLCNLLNHTWNGAFNWSSEKHEGKSTFGASHGIHPALASVDLWEQATAADDAFGLTVPWLKSSLTVNQQIDAMLQECRPSAGGSILMRAARGKSTPSLVAKLLNLAQKTVGK